MTGAATSPANAGPWKNPSPFRAVGVPQDRPMQAPSHENREGAPVVVVHEGGEEIVLRGPDRPRNRCRWRRRASGWFQRRRAPARCRPPRRAGSGSVRLLRERKGHVEAGEIDRRRRARAPAAQRLGPRRAWNPPRQPSSASGRSSPPMSRSRRPGVRHEAATSDVEGDDGPRPRQGPGDYPRTGVAARHDGQRQEHPDGCPRARSGVRTQSALPPKAQETPTMNTATCAATAYLQGRGGRIGLCGSPGHRLHLRALAKRRIEFREGAGRLLPRELPKDPARARSSRDGRAIHPLRRGGPERGGEVRPRDAPAGPGPVQPRPGRRVRDEGGHAVGERLGDREPEILTVGGEQE